MRRNTAKRILVGLAVASISGFVPLILSSAGSATAFGGQVTAPIQKNNGYCGRNLRGRPVLGQIVFTRSGNELSLAVSMSNAPADQTYSIYLYTGTCDYLGQLGSITTNSQGTGGGAFTAAVSSTETRFFGDPGNDSLEQANDTPIVSVP
jgi:hypothetical protein